MYGSGWKPRTITKMIAEGRPFAWVQGVHYFHVCNAYSINLTAIHRELSPGMEE